MEGSGSHIQTEQIQASCRALFAPGQVVELRVLGINGNPKAKAAGWFDDTEALSRAALAYDVRRPQGIYVTLNPLLPACLARGNNQIKDAPGSATSDRDVLRRHWLPIDIDPTRPAGVSSTNAELETARDLAVEIAGWLEGDLGFPPGLRAHSGNGIHLLYRVDLPNDDIGKGIIANCLSALNGRYNGKASKIDLANANAARIWKLWGTAARKGEHTPDRPHRYSKLLPTAGVLPNFADIGVVTTAQLDQLAALRTPVSSPPERTAKGRAKATSSRGARKKAASDGEAYFDLYAWIQDNHIPIVREEAWDGTGRRYILDHCLFDESHTNTSAALGRSRDGNIWYQCMHDSCAGRQWADAKALFANDGQRRRQTVAAVGVTEKLPDDPWALAKKFLDEEMLDADTGQALLRRHRETYYQYTRSRRAYRELSDDTIRVLVTRWHGDAAEKTTRTKIKDILDCLGAIVTVPADIEIPFVSRVDPESGCTQGNPHRYNRIALRNGVLDLDRIMRGDPIDQCLLPHSTEWFDTSALPFDFPTEDGQLETPVWTQFLNEIFDEDETRIALLQEAFGYCFFTDTSLETFFVFHGQGRNGKSTVLGVLRNLLGEINVCSLTPEQLADRFMVYGLYGKLANLCADMSEMDTVQEGVVKATVTGDLITCDRKYKESMQFRSRAKMFFATNVLPRFTDTSLGIWRRMAMIPFDYVCPLSKIDTHLFEKLDAEMPGIFMWALQGMLRLKTARRFTASPRCAAAGRDYKLKCFPILMFMEECTRSEGQITAGELWNAYRRWGEECGLKKPKALHAFVADVLNFEPSIQYARTAKGMESRLLLHGISLAPNVGAAIAPQGLPAAAVETAKLPW